jgi:hypothetical protein
MEFNREYRKWKKDNNIDVLNGCVKGSTYPSIILFISLILSLSILMMAISLHKRNEMQKKREKEAVQIVVLKETPQEEDPVETFVNDLSEYGIAFSNKVLSQEQVERVYEESKEVVEVAQADSDCQNPALLDDNMREAYYQLKALEKEIDGMSVSIRCW